MKQPGGKKKFIKMHVGTDMVVVMKLGTNAMDRQDRLTKNLLGIENLLIVNLSHLS